MTRILVHDRRLIGNPPPVADALFQPNEKAQTNALITYVAQRARQLGAVDELLVMCHGVGAPGSRPANASSVCEPTGLRGLQLGTPGLTVMNVHLTKQWKGLFRRIFLYACGASAANRDWRFDGKRLCAELASCTGAVVYASDKLQWYGRRSGNVIDFGSWEGQVSAFSPGDPNGASTILGPMPRTR